jgi:hypothetical protein
MNDVLLRNLRLARTSLSLRRLHPPPQPPVRCAEYVYCRVSVEFLEDLNARTKDIEDLIACVEYVLACQCRVHPDTRAL